MKKKHITLLAAGVMAVSLAACGGSKSATTQEAASQTKTEQAENVSQEKAPDTQTSETAVKIANPWREVTYQEASDTVSKLFKAPEGAENVEWIIYDGSKDVVDVSNPLVQMTFDLDGQSYIAREQITGDETSDISGMYYNWTVSEDITLDNWSDGQTIGKHQIYIGDSESVDVCTWYDSETGTSYSLSTSAENLDGFDLKSIVEAIYDSSTQSGANASKIQSSIRMATASVLTTLATSLVLLT